MVMGHGVKNEEANNPMIREERKQKKNKEHFIHIGPKLKAAREFSSLNLTKIS